MGDKNLSVRAYLGWVGALAAGLFALAWAWVALMPLAFLDPEYPAWLAKRTMLRTCDLGRMLVVGDSRAADVMPTMMPLPTTNLAVGGGEPIEALVAVRRALACPHPPERVIVSFGPGHLMQPDLFWERTVRFGFLGPADVAALGRVSRRIGDMSVYENGHGDGLRGSVRAALYAVRFPSLYFASLAKGGLFLRWWENRRALAAGLARRGQFSFGVAAGSTGVTVEGHLERFAPLPILDHYFDQTLALLTAHGIRVDFVAMPVNEATWQVVRPALRDGFAAYLRRYEAKYPSFRVLGTLMPHWPNRFFGDEFAHLNPDGAALFSARVAWCLSDNTACALSRSRGEQARSGQAGIESGG
ncbi:MAG: hypothetical protein M3Y41_19510 [Pseudomonadota bacterium]|nr:hypothetical protein [Pseudomonadota bacterium]